MEPPHAQTAEHPKADAPKKRLDGAGAEAPRTKRLQLKNAKQPKTNTQSDGAGYDADNLRKQRWLEVLEKDDMSDLEKKIWVEVLARAAAFRKIEARAREDADSNLLNQETLHLGGSRNVVLSQKHENQDGGAEMAPLCASAWGTLPQSYDDGNELFTC